MKSSYDKLREKVRAKEQANDSLNMKFIFEGNSSIECAINGRKQRVAVVLQEDKDMAYVYTQLDKPLDIGTCFEVKDIRPLIIKKCTFIKDVWFNKYEAVLANVEVQEGVWGYFKSPEESYINTKIESGAVEVSLQKPILVAPAGIFKVGDKFLIKDRPWEVIETDTIASDYITYYSLKSTTIEKKHDYQDKVAKVRGAQSDRIEVKPLEKIILTTEQGYFKSSINFTDKQLKLNAVQFKVPFGVDEFEVTVKEQGLDKTIKYKVV